MAARRRFGSVFAGVVLAASYLATSPPAVSAASYEGTNPKATPCWDGSHSVVVWRNYWIFGPGGIWGRVQLIYSPYCNTVWTSVSNMTGVPASGSITYGAAHTLTAQEEIIIYTCTKSTCSHRYSNLTGDVLKPYGSSPRTGWSNQLVVPRGGGDTINGAVQPPTVRAIGKLTLGSTTYTGDGLLEPLWTAQSGYFANESYNRGNSWPNMSCDNDIDLTQNPPWDHRCNNWGETGSGGRLPLTYVVAPSVSALVRADVNNTIVPAWNSVTGADQPTFVPCTGSGCSPCTGNSCTSPAVTILMSASDAGDTMCYAHGYGDNLPVVRYHCDLGIQPNPAPAQNWAHPCNDNDSGCA
jgi:hypothetical protein